MSKILKKTFWPLPIILVLLSPLASSFPDGLEYTAAKLGFISREIALWKHALFPDYSVPIIKNEAFSTILAGGAGLMLTYLFTVFIFRLKKHSQK